MRAILTGELSASLKHLAGQHSLMFVVVENDLSADHSVGEPSERSMMRALPPGRSPFLRDAGIGRLVSKVFGAEINRQMEPTSSNHRILWSIRRNRPQQRLDLHLQWRERRQHPRSSLPTRDGRGTGV